MKKEIKELEEEVIDDKTIFDKINFRDLFVVKKQEGIYLTLGVPNKSKLIGIRKWGDIFNRDSVSKTVSAIDLTNLDSLVFYTIGKDIPNLGLKDVFNNLYNYESSLTDNLGVEDFNIKDNTTLLNLMDIAVPDYDPEEFKTYHMKKLVKYYMWTKEAIEGISNLTEKK